LRIAFSTSGVVKHEDYKSGDVLGTEYQVFGLSKELVKRGHEVYIVRRWYNGPKEEEIQGIKVVNVASPNFSDSLIKKAMTQVIFSKYAAKEIEQIEPDILNLTAKYSSYSMCKLNIPIIYTTHTGPSDLVPKALIPFRSIFGGFHPTKWLESRIYRNCDAIVALNEEHRQYLSNRGFRTVFIPNGVDIEKYTPTYSDEGYIYFSGRIVKKKGLNYLIKAYSMLGSELQDRFELVIGGFGLEKENLEKLASEHGIKDRILFLSWLSNLDFIKKVASCSVYVMPSLHEGLPVALLETMALGKPMIASNISGIQEVITHGRDGFLFETGNVSELKKYLELLLEDKELRERTGKNARKTVEEGYTFEKVADRHIKLYGELIDSHERKSGIN
jgi:glycosyltransferase involved in cell wall biosynthesis